MLSDMETSALEALREAGGPLTAYAVLEKLRDARPSAAAPTAYRALSRLVGRGLVHRLETINAYVACCAVRDCTAPLFAICERCGHVAERSAPRLASDLAEAAAEGGFVPQKSVVELIGRCADCRKL